MNYKLAKCIDVESIHYDSRLKLNSLYLVLEFEGNLHGNLYNVYDLNKKLIGKGYYKKRFKILPDTKMSKLLYG